MKILVVSDTHGRWGALYNVIKAHPDADTVIHLGDGNDDLERVRAEFPHQTLVGVAGNCDFLAVSGTRSACVLEANGKTIFFTHGHNYRVKSGEGLVEQAARARNADIGLYGHTHVPCCHCRDGLHIMNPGSVGHPRDDQPTCGVIEINNGVITMKVENCIL